ncbi:putative DNA-binding protein [Escherichia coli]|nr:putative DNA-binding protein [Escherichia coli]
MTTILHPNYVVVSKLISKFDITHDSRDENINILISVIYDLDNGGNDSNLLIVFYVQIMPDDFVMQLHRF